jgi:hypothetical protein
VIKAFSYNIKLSCYEFFFFFWFCSGCVILLLLVKTGKKNIVEKTASNVENTIISLQIKSGVGSSVNFPAPRNLPAYSNILESSEV